MKRTSSGGSMSFPRLRNTSGVSDASYLTADGGCGHSVTACMADFSLYIFHPYGGGQKKTSLSALESSFRRGGLGRWGAGQYVAENIVPCGLGQKLCCLAKLIISPIK